MTDRELDALLDGAAGAKLTLGAPGGRETVLHFTRHDLRTPGAWRAAMRRQFGHTGYCPPRYSQRDHDQIVRALFRLADAGRRERREAALAGSVRAVK